MQSETAILSSPSIWREASRIVNEEGFRAFWKGNLVTVAHRLPYSAVNFYAYEEYNTVSWIRFYFWSVVFSTLCSSVIICSFFTRIQY